MEDGVLEEFDYDDGALCKHGWTNQFIDCPKCEYEAELKAEAQLENECNEIFQSKHGKMARCVLRKGHEERGRESHSGELI